LSFMGSWSSSTKKYTGTLTIGLNHFRGTTLTRGVVKGCPA
jgi:hypothetical protein